MRARVCVCMSVGPGQAMREVARACFQGLSTQSVCACWERICGAPTMWMLARWDLLGASRKWGLKGV